MAFVDTLDSLKKSLKIQQQTNYAAGSNITFTTNQSTGEITISAAQPDISNLVNNTALDTKLSKSLEKSVTVTASNNTFTIDPNVGGLFLVNVTANSTIAISSLDSDYTSTGSVFSILLTLGNSSYTVAWPNNITWSDGQAPSLTYKNLITLIKFDSSSNWVGGHVLVDSTFPS